MASTVEGLLRERRERATAGRIAGTLSSLLLHVGIVAFALAAPTLFAKEREPLEYVPVLLVPPQILGVESPPPEPPTTTPTPEPTPEPEPVVDEPSPDAMTLPSEEEAPPEPQPEPRPEPKPTEPAPEPVASDSPPANQRQGSSTGSPVGIANTDSLVGIEDPNFTYGYYVNRMVSIIRSQWQRPPLGSGVQGIVHFRIRRDGSVQDVEVVNSSGYNSFDLAALRAVQSAPLPPLPKSYKEKSLGVNLIFR